MNTSPQAPRGSSSETGQRLVATPLSASEPAKVDFLKLVLSASEGHLRALDTKAQIMLAAFVLSWNPLLTVAHASCSRGVAPAVLGTTACLIIATVMVFGYAVWPSTPSRSSSPRGFFYLLGRQWADHANYLAELGEAVMAEELAREVIKLALLRDRKTRRLRLALVSAAVSYAVFAGMLGWPAHCV